MSRFKREKFHLERSSERSIKQKLLVTFLLLTALLAVICCGVGCVFNYVTARDDMERLLVSTAEHSANEVRYQLNDYKNTAISLGMTPRLSREDVDNATKVAMLNEWVDYFGLERGDLLDRNGRSLVDGTDYSAKDSFQKALQKALSGETYVSSPTVDSSGEIHFVITAPVWQNGTRNSTVTGIVCLYPKASFLVENMKDLTVSEHGNAYMIDAEGYTIADTVKENIGVENIEENAKSDKDLEALAALNAEMRQGQSGVGRYSYGGEKNKMLAYAPVLDTDGWALAITTPAKDFMTGAYQNIAITIVLVLVVMAACGVVVIRVSRKISQPIKECAERLETLSRGDLTSPVPQYDSRDEIGTLSAATANIVTGLHDIIRDEDYLLKEMAAGNFAVTTNHPEVYVGDMAAVLDSLRHIKTNLSSTLRQIEQASDQVAAGADQVASGAQALAQGATEQASVVQELSASIVEIDDGSQNNAKAAGEARDLVDEAVGQVRLSHEKMTDLRDAMHDILQGHEEISQIISTIENIAFQTNILALNAAVEAARAGSSGKGFAVVADEVRNLAAKSDEAAKQTKQLIEQSTLNVERGGQLTEDVSHALDEAAAVANSAQQNIANVVESIISSAGAIDQVTSGMDQISSVVQTNSATAEQSAAASEELSGQSQVMKELVDKFTLVDTTATPTTPTPPTATRTKPAASTPSSGTVFDKY